LKQGTLPCGFSIAGVATFGPTLSIAISAQLNKLTVSGSVTFGLNMNLPGSITRADLFNSKGNAIDGGRFIPNFTPIQPSVNVQATVQGQIGRQLALAIEASLFGTGTSTGLVLLAPTLVANVQANVNTQGGVCNNSNIRAGISFAFGFGAHFDAFGSLQPTANFPNRGNILTAQQSLFSTCMALAKRVESTPTGIASLALLV
jgi:hypothetical protein